MYIRKYTLKFGTYIPGHFAVFLLVFAYLQPKVVSLLQQKQTFLFSSTAGTVNGSTNSKLL